MDPEPGQVIAPKEGVDDEVDNGGDKGQDNVMEDYTVDGVIDFDAMPKQVDSQPVQKDAQPVPNQEKYLEDQVGVKIVFGRQRA